MQDNHHRRGVFVVDGHAMTSRRYAIDWMQSVDGALFSGDPLDNRSYHVYRKSVLAVADAAVAEARDGFPDRPSGPPLRAPEQGQVAQDPGYSLLDHCSNVGNYFREIRPDRVQTEPLAVERQPGDSMCPAARVFLDEPDLCAGRD